MFKRIRDELFASPVRAISGSLYSHGVKVFFFSLFFFHNSLQCFWRKKRCSLIEYTIFLIRSLNYGMPFSF